MKFAIWFARVVYYQLKKLNAIDGQQRRIKNSNANTLWTHLIKHTSIGTNNSWKERKHASDINDDVQQAVAKLNGEHSDNDHNHHSVLAPPEERQNCVCVCVFEHVCLLIINWKIAFKSYSKTDTRRLANPVSHAISTAQKWM